MKWPVVFVCLTHFVFAADKHQYGLWHLYSTFHSGTINQTLLYESDGSEESESEWSRAQKYLLVGGEGFNEEATIEWIYCDMSRLGSFPFDVLGLSPRWLGDVDTSGQTVGPDGVVEPKTSSAFQEVFRIQIGWDLFTMFGQPLIWAIDIGMLEHPSTGKIQSGDGHAGLAFHYIMAFNEDIRLKPHLALNATLSGGLWDVGGAAHWDCLPYLTLYGELRNMGIGYKTDDEVEVTTSETAMRIGVAINLETVGEKFF